jgi:hypothetical protein
MATVIDIASRRVVGYAMADHLRTELIYDALANAVAARNPAPGVIFHSDRGYLGSTPRAPSAKISFQNLTRMTIIIVISVGRPWANCCACSSRVSRLRLSRALRSVSVSRYWLTAPARSW